MPSTQTVTVIGPNLPRPLCDSGTLHVHAAGCADIRRQRGYRASEPHWDIEATSIESIVIDIYGDPMGDTLGYGTYYHPGDPEWPIYRNDVHVFPCVQLPEEEPK